MIIPHNRLTYSDDEINAVSDVIRSGHWTSGNKTETLEKKISSFFSASHALATSSGISSLRLSLIAMGVKKGDCVLVPAYSCVAIPNAVLSLGAVPVPVDIAPDTLNLNPSSISNDNGTKIVIAVNTFGIAADVASLKNLGLMVIEDCAHGFSINEDYHPQKLRADITIFSFYATKLIGGSKGGAVLTDRKDWADIVYDYRDYEDKAPDGLKMNDKMSDIDAELIRCQLARIQDTLQARERLASIYTRAFSDIEAIAPAHARNRVWYRYALRLKDGNKKKIIQRLQEQGVAAREPVECWLSPDRIKEYPEAAAAYDSIISIPLYPTLTDDEQKIVIESMKRVLK